MIFRPNPRHLVARRTFAQRQGNCTFSKVKRSGRGRFLEHFRIEDIHAHCFKGARFGASQRKYMAPLSLRRVAAEPAGLTKGDSDCVEPSPSLHMLSASVGSCVAALKHPQLPLP